MWPERTCWVWHNTAPFRLRGSLMPALAPGLAAPAFSLPRSPSETAALDDFRGHPVVLVFYPADWSPVCGDQLALYTELHDVFAQHHAKILGISVDGPWCHEAFVEAP